MPKDKVFMMVTTDKYSLPLAVADSAVELAKIVGDSPNTVSSTISHGRERNRPYKYIRVILDD